MPTYTDIGSDYATLRLGLQIRQHRRRRGWTLADLSRRLSVSPATLSAIENEKITLDVERLVAICDTLEISPDTLLPRSKTAHFCIARRADVESQPALPMKLVDRTTGALMTYQNRLRPLADAFVGKYIDPFAIEIHQVAEDKIQFISHHHEEFFFVLSGQVECFLKTPDGQVRETLGPGDCMSFWSYLPHCIRSTGSQPARCIHVLCSLHEPADSESTTGDAGLIYMLDAFHKNLTEQVAGKIRSLRRAHGMTAAAFAERLGISVRRLMEIERGHASISLDLLLRICRSFRKPKEYFLACTAVDRPFYQLLRAGAIRDGLSRWRRAADQRCRCVTASALKPLATELENRGMYSYLVKLHSGKRAGEPMRRHHGQEFLYVLNGEVQILTTFEGKPFRETLSAGDSCFIDSRVSHRFVGAGLSPYQKESTEAIAIFWHPPGVRFL